MFFKILITLATLTLSTASLATTNEFNTPTPKQNQIVNIQYWQTANGAKVYFVDEPELPMLDIRVVFAAGSVRDGNQFGLAQLTNSMLDEGSTKLNADQIAAAFDDVGAQFLSDTNKDQAMVGLRTLTDPKYLDPAIKTFSTVISAPSFPEKAFKRVKQQTLSAIEQQKQSPGTVVSNAFYKALYPNQGYGHPELGTLNTIALLTVNDLKKFYQQYYVANNAIIAMIGNINRNTASKIATQISLGLVAGKEAPKLSPIKTTTTNETIHIIFPSQQTNIYLGQLGIEKNSPDFFPLLVGNYILGGGGLVSQLFNEVREQRGLAYDVQSAFVTLQDKGPFIIALQTRNDKAAHTIAIVNQLLANFMTNGPTEQQLTAAKKNIIGSFIVKLSSNAAIINNVVNIAFYKFPLSYLDTYRQKVDAVTIEQIKQAFNKTIHLNKMLTVTVGKSENASTTTPS